MGRERITISVQDSLVRRIDRLIDKQEIRNRSHAIESLLNKALSTSTVDHAVLFIGGNNTSRAHAYIRAVYTSMKEFGMQSVWFVLGEQGQTVQTDLKTSLPGDLIAHFHTTKQGSGGGLKEIIDELPERFWFFNIDSTTRLDLEQIVAFHEHFRPTVTIKHLGSSLFQGYGIAEKGIEEHIPEGFSLLEEDVFPILLNQHQLIYIP